MKINNIKINKLSESNWKEWKELKLEAFKNHPDLFSTSCKDCSKLKDQDYKDEIKKNTIFGVFHDNNLVGSIMFSFYNLDKEKHKGYMSLVYIKSEMRGQGLGNKLLETIIKHAKNKVSQLNLEVFAQNERAKGLYKKYGFKTYGVEPHALKNDDKFYDKELMSLKLC